MTRQEAEHACTKLAEEHPDRDTHRWVPHQAEDGIWDVAKIALPPQRQEEVTAEQRADERPPTADDPRPMRDIGGPHVGPGI
jgi:hypothetical protein